jgi:Protein of unknown function (DUF2971)
MENLTYVETGKYLFRFLNPQSQYFWPAIGDLLSEQLVLNSRKNFNDPYDSQPIIVSDLSNYEIRRYFNEAMLSPFHPKRSLQGTARILEYRANGKINLKKGEIDDIKDKLRENAKQILDSGGLLSFSLTAENSLLWAHYAASFTGICAVFKRGASLRSGLALCAKVTYVQKRPQLPLSLIHEMNMRRMAEQPYDELAKRIFFLSFLHKSDDWAYEREARIFCPFYAFKKLRFDSNELVGFILGPLSSRTLEDKLRREIKLRRASTSLDRANLSQSDFRIIIPHKFLQLGANVAA